MNKDNLIFKIGTYFIIVLLAALIIVVGNMICSTEIETEDNGEFYKAKVISVEGIREQSIDLTFEDDQSEAPKEEIKEEATDESNNLPESEEQPKEEDYDTMLLDEEPIEEESVSTNKTLIFTAEILSGEMKGQTVTAFQDVNELYGVTPINVKEGQKIIIAYSDSGSEFGLNWYFAEPYRTNNLILLTAIFLIMILIIGRWKGITTIIALIFDVLIIFLVYIPSIFKEYNIYLTTTIVSILIVIISLLLINGVNKKTLAAVLGNLGGLIIAGIIAVFMNEVLRMTGLVDEEYLFLTNESLGFVVDLRATIWAGIVIGALGAIMDVAMSISSATNELAENIENPTFSTLFRSAMNIGEDAIGTMTNTLILAYIGSSLANVLLFIAYNKHLVYLFNTEMIALEVLQAIVGSIGILFAVPSTAIFAASMFGKKDTDRPKKKKRKKEKLKNKEISNWKHLN